MEAIGYPLGRLRGDCPGSTLTPSYIRTSGKFAIQSYTAHQPACRIPHGRSRLCSVMQPSVSCPGCGGVFPDIQGTTHKYIGASSGCWEIYCQVLPIEYGEYDYLRETHELTVATYAVQLGRAPSSRVILGNRCLEIMDSAPRAHAEVGAVAGSSIPSIEWLQCEYLLWESQPPVHGW